MTGQRPSHVFTLQEAVGAAPSLASLKAQAEASSACMAQVSHLIPPVMRAHVQAGPLQAGEWCLLTPSPAAASKLRHMVPLLLRALNERGAQVSAIRIKVQSPGR